MKSLTFIRFTQLLVLLSLSAVSFATQGEQNDGKNKVKRKNHDGVILINQQRALEGKVTPGDTPGFPVSITRPGSYKLTSNLVVGDRETDAILIVDTFSDVITIDLNGFSIQGPCVNGVGTCEQTNTGRGLATISPVRIFNGAITGMAGGGIRCLSICDIERVNIAGNAGPGIGLNVGSVRNSFVLGNGNIDIRIMDLGLVSGNIIGKLFIGAAVGYVNNQINSPVMGGTQLGPNLCIDQICP
jgi:hypothetical protein